MSKKFTPSTPSHTRKPNDNSEPRGSFAGIMYPGKNDVMLGRGGESNFHSGNLKFREFAQVYREQYKRASKGTKPKIAAEVVAAWRRLDPPGRFLARNNPTCQDSLWYDVGEQLAVKRAIKTLGEKSQRERRAEKRKQGGRGIPLERRRSTSTDAGSASGSLPDHLLSDHAAGYFSSSSQREERFSTSSDDADRKMPPVESLGMEEVTLNSSLARNLMNDDGASTSSSSYGSHQPDGSAQVTSVQKIGMDTIVPDAAGDHDLAMDDDDDDDDPFRREDVWQDPTTLPTAAHLAETVFDEED